jgi:hypothetical protein
MKRGRWLVATVLAMAAVAAPAQGATQDYAHLIHSDQRFVLEPNSTHTYSMRIAGLGTDANVLLPCWGFDIAGPGVSLAAADLHVFGPVIPEPGEENKPDGGMPGAVRQPDGSFAYPDSDAVLDARTLAFGEGCRAVDWDFYASDGKVQIDPWGNPVSATGVTGARAASAKARARAKARHRKVLRRAQRKMRGATAQDGQVAVTLAGLRNVPGNPWGAEVVVTVRTGPLAGRTTLTMHARVLPQSMS